MTDTTATPSSIRDLMKPWGDGNPINHMGLFQQLDNYRRRCFGGGVQSKAGKRQESVRARIIVWGK